MLSRSILNWLVLLLTLLATVTRSEHYHIVPVDSTDSCRDYRNGTCFTLEQLVQTDLLSGGDNLTLSFLPGDHVLTEQLLISKFSHVQIIGQNTSTAVVGFHSNGAILFVSITELIIEGLGFIGANIGPHNSHQGLIIDGAHDVYIKDCYFMDFELLNQAETHIVKIANTQTATIESTLFMNNTGRALHVEADDVYITNSKFARNYGGAVESDFRALINNILYRNSNRNNYNSAENGGAVEVVSGAVVITWSTFTNNKGSHFGGAIHVVSGSVSIFDSTLTNNDGGGGGGGAISVFTGSVSISDSTLTNNSADGGGGAIGVVIGSVSIFNCTLKNNRAAKIGGGAIGVSKGSVSISNSELTNNRADYVGGEAIGVTSGGVGGGGAIGVGLGSVSISNSKLTNNRADDGGSRAIGVTPGSVGGGGAIGVGSGNVSISNSELTNNRAYYGGGGAIRVDSGSVSISNSDLTNNSADFNGVSISDSMVTYSSSGEGGAIFALNSIDN